jgi:4-aminobutyrate aminotransferase-like enzyme
MVPDGYRGPYKRNDPMAGSKYAEDVMRIVDDLQSKGKKLAAFLCESIQGCGGQVWIY